jgi:hypothetical protein
MFCLKNYLKLGMHPSLFEFRILEFLFNWKENNENTILEDRLPNG